MAENLYTKLKSLIPEYLKARNRDLKILRLVISEADLIIARDGKVSDDQVLKAIKKIYASNEEVLGTFESEELRQEQQWLSQFIPVEPSYEETLQGVREIELCGKMGIDMKNCINALPGHNKAFISKAISEVLKETTRT
jgi:hypothetical protein